MRKLPSKLGWPRPSWGFRRPSESSLARCQGLVGLDPSGVPFDGFPVFHLTSTANHCSDPRFLSWTCGPLQGLIRSSTTRRRRLASQTSSSGKPPWALVLSNACSKRGLFRRVCQSPLEPAPSVSTLPADRPAGHLACLPGLFHPGNVPELLPSGLCVPSRDPEPVSEPRSSLAVGLRSKPGPSTSEVSSLWKAVSSPNAVFQTEREAHALLVFAFPL